MLAIASPVESVFGELRARLERAGHQIGGKRSVDRRANHFPRLHLGDDNEHELSRIAELPCANWLR